MPIPAGGQARDVVGVAWPIGHSGLLLETPSGSRTHRRGDRLAAGPSLIHVQQRFCVREALALLFCSKVGAGGAGPDRRYKSVSRRTRASVGERCGGRGAVAGGKCAASSSAVSSGPEGRRGVHGRTCRPLAPAGARLSPAADSWGIAVASRRALQGTRTAPGGPRCGGRGSSPGGLRRREAAPAAADGANDGPLSRFQRRVHGLAGVSGLRHGKWV